MTMLKQSEQRRRIQQVLKEELNVLEVPENAKRQDFPEWDSLTFMSIVSRMESEFGIEAQPENINAFDSIDGILAEIQRSGK